MASIAIAKAEPSSLYSFQRPAHKKTLSSVAVGYLGTKSGFEKMVLKPVNLSLQTSQMMSSGLSERGKAISKMTHDTQQIFYLAGLPSSVHSFSKDLFVLKDSFKKRAYKDMAKAGAKAGVSGAGLSLSLAGLVQAGCKASLYALSDRSVAILKRVGAVGQVILIGSSIWDIAKYSGRIKEANKIYSNEGCKKEEIVKAKEKILFSFCKILEKLTVISLLTIGVLAFLTGMFISGWIFIFLSALGLVLSTGTYFYDQIHSPYEKKALVL